METLGVDCLLAYEHVLGAAPATGTGRNAYLYQHDGLGLQTVDDHLAIIRRCVAVMRG